MGACGSSRTTGKATIKLDNSKGMAKPYSEIAKLDTQVVHTSLMTLFSVDTESEEFSLSTSDLEKFNNAVGSDLTAKNLWQDPSDLMYEKIYDKEFLHRSEASLEKEGITGPLFDKKVSGAIKSLLKGKAKEATTKHGQFKYRYV